MEQARAQKDGEIQKNGNEIQNNNAVAVSYLMARAVSHSQAHGLKLCNT
jgi:hypothetical protein